MALVVALQPVTMVMAWIAFGDTLLLTDLIGLGVVLIGVIITLFQAPNPETDTPSSITLRYNE